MVEAGPKPSPAGRAKGAAPAKPLIGVATTTPLAFFLEGKLYLERMNVLAQDGAGVLSEVVPPIGTHLQIVFRLSTTSDAVRCRGEVLAGVPTTPNGVLLRSKVGERAFKAAMGSTIGDSATMIFRTEDLEKLRPKKTAATQTRQPARQSGFCIRFLDLDAHGAGLVAEHLQISRRLSEQLALHGGKLEGIARNEQATMSAMFDDDGDLSKKARDW
jgi:hypothetical protein